MRFIQVGVGGFGNRWVNCLKDNPQAEVVAMVDVNPAALEKACQVSGRKPEICFPTLDAALAKVQTDAVVVVTPPEYHRAPVVAALEAGLHVISEKPMADSMANCKAMLQAARRTGKTYVVSQNYRYSPATWTMNRLVQEGALGTLGQAKLDFYMGVDFRGGFRHVMDYPLLVDMSIHHFDLIRFITGLDAVEVRGTAWNPPWSNYQGDCASSVVFTMNNGARVVYNACWCAKGQFCDWNANWQIEGEKGTLVYQRGELQQLTVPTLYKVEKTEPVKLEGPSKGGQDFVLQDFMDSIAAGRRPRTDVADNIRSIAMVFAAVKAVQTGKAVKVLDAATERLLAG